MICPYCKKVFSIAAKTFVPPLVVSGAEIDLARAGGAAVLVYQYGTNDDILGYLDDCIVQQEPDSPSGLHENPAPFNAVWVKKESVRQIRLFLGNRPDVRIFE